ncbi:hypothetical protein [Haloferula sargassicola]
MKTSVLLTSAAFLFPPSLPGYDLHEWGTFTTVAGSDGVLLSGVQREEEALPDFVRHHPGFHHVPHAIRAGSKSMPLPVSHVTVKMETPVIYFHSDEGFRAEVKVGFQGGSISQWFPERSGGETVEPGSAAAFPPPSFLDFSKPYHGSIEWEVDVLSPPESRNTVLFKPGDLLQWTRARIPEANVVRAGDGSTEGFLFYRGLGNFEPGLRTTVAADETLSLHNDTGGIIPYLLIYEKMSDGSSRWLQHGDPLLPGNDLRFPESKLRSGKPGFDDELYSELVRHLAGQGLLPSESAAMVQTWWQSYFDTPGLRVFWVLPASRTSAILPLRVEPAPETTIRILVGRSEVIRPRSEQAWLALATSEIPEERRQWASLVGLDRFGLAYAERIKSLQSRPKETAAR